MSRKRETISQGKKNIIQALLLPLFLRLTDWVQFTANNLVKKFNLN